MREVLSEITTYLEAALVSMTEWPDDIGDHLDLGVHEINRLRDLLASYMEDQVEQ